MHESTVCLIFKNEHFSSNSTNLPKTEDRQTDMTMWHLWQKKRPSARLCSSGSLGGRLCCFLNASVSPARSPTRPLSMLANLHTASMTHSGTPDLSASW